MLATPEVEEQDLQSSETEVSVTRGMMLSDSLPEGMLPVAVNVSENTWCPSFGQLLYFGYSSTGDPEANRWCSS